MLPCVRPSTRILLLAAAILCATATADPAPPRAASEGESGLAALPVVRLRKLHLVRPDLIPYPIAYEVVC
jgi:hypothetical protein